MPDLALEGLRVVDLSQGIAGPYCAKLLADCGAEVIKVEPPEGDHARRLGPFPEDVPHHDRGGLFIHLNGNKKSVTLDAGSESGRVVLRKLLARSDVLVESEAPGRMVSLGLGHDDLKEAFPELVYCSVTPFGQTGPYSGFRGNSLACMALSGLMVAADYQNPAIKNLIWHLKYNSVKDISDTLAMIMADHLVGSDLVDYFHEALVVPVPAHRQRQRFRGFNQAAEIGKRLARNLNLEYAPVLIKTEKTDRQVDLEKGQRLENVKGVFAADPEFDAKKLSGRSVLLIDDVATTGATLNECAQVLRPHNPSEIWGLVVARN